MRLYSRQISPLFLGLALLLFAAQEPRAQSPVAVTLLPGTSPAAAEPGVTTIAVTGSNFPAGTIPAANVTVSIAKAGGIGPTTGVKATAVATVTGTTRRVTFTVPSTISVVSPTSYVISIAGSTSTGVAFSSSNSAAMTVNPAASLSGVTPATGQPGQTLSVSVTGVFTNFLQGSTVAGFGAGITIVSLTVTNATHATASITLAANAAGGPRTVTMTTGVEVATQANGFTVQAPTLLSVNPNSGPQGQQNIPVTITGQFTHFSNASIVSFANLGVTAGAPTGATSTSITVPVSIGAAATLGVTNVTVTTGAEVVTLTNGFTVQPTPNRPPVVTSSGCSQTVSMMPSQVTVTEFAIPTANVGPGGITLGSDCNLWFAESRGNTVGRITPAGVITELPPFAAAGGAGSLSYITAGPDGNLWATDYSGGNIWRITTAGVTTAFPTGGGYPSGITAGRDGNIWFVERFGNSVGRITPAGAITAFPIPTPSSQPYEINAGPDGNLWFTEFAGKIGRITPSGVITEFPVLSQPVDIIAGPDGNLWFTEPVANQIGRITPAGVITEFPVPTPAGGPTEIAAGPDGNLWFMEDTANKIGRISTGGVITEFPITGPNRHLYGITTGPDGNLWFAEANGNNIGRINPLTGIAIATLTGTVTDDGLPAGATLATTWTETSGPGPVSFGIPSATFPDVAARANPVGTLATFSIPGTYTLTLTGNDSQLTGSSSVTVTVNPAQVPAILSVNPNTGQQGQQNIPVTITGQFTHFSNASVVIFANPGVTSGAPTAVTATSITVPVSIAPGAPLGATNVTVTTGGEVVTLANAFTVLAGTPVITLVNPNTGPPGSQNLLLTVTSQFTHFFQGVTIASLGAGITLKTLTVNSATSLTLLINIDPGAVASTRDVTVSTNSEIVTLVAGFTVPANQPPTVSAGPNQTIPGVTQAASRSALGGNDFIDWGQLGPFVPPAAFLPNLSSPQTVKSNTGIPVTLSGTDFGFDQQAPSAAYCNCWNGNFAPGDNLIFAGNTGLTITFGTPVYGFGTQLGVDADVPPGSAGIPIGGKPFLPGDPFTGQMFLYDANGSPIDTITAFGVMNSNGDNSAVFIGARSTTPIKSVTFATSPVPVFAINRMDLLLNPPAVTLNGTLSDDALPVGAGLNASWSQTSGPGTVSFSQPTATFPNVAGQVNTATTSAAFSVPGTYVLTLTGTDSQLVSSSNVTVTVNPPQVPTLLSASPNAGQQGQKNIPVTITGQFTHFGSSSVVSFANGAITAGPPTAATATSITVSVSIAAAATPGTMGVTVTTGSEVVTLPGGFTVVAGTPVLTSLVPASGQRGQTVPFTVTGNFTHFAQGATQVSLGAGITISAISVTSATALTAQASIDAAASVGTRNITVTSGGEVVSLAGAFGVEPTTAAITLLNPSFGAQGQQISSIAITGQFTHFVQGTSQVSFGSDIAVNSVTVSNGTSLAVNITIPINANATARTVTVSTGQEVVSLGSAFTVLAACINGKESGVRISEGPSGSLDATGLGDPSVVNLPGGGLRMYYDGVTGRGTSRPIDTVLSATSADGLTWTKEPGVRLAAGGSDDFVVFGRPKVVELADGSLRMYFTGNVLTPAGTTGLIILSAVSSDGLTWTKEPGRRIDIGGPFGCVNVSGAEIGTLSDGTLRMYYSCSLSPQSEWGTIPPDVGPPGMILSATSADGLVWTTESGVRLTPPANTIYREMAIRSLPDGTKRMYFGEGYDGFLVSAVSPDGLAWTIEPGARIDYGPPGSPDSRYVLEPYIVALGDGTFRTYYNGSSTAATGTDEADNILSYRLCSLGVNNPPTVTAGRNQSVTPPQNSISLNGIASDDRLPQGSTLTYLWTVASGPAPVTFTNNSALATNAIFVSPGVYTLRLIASDSQLLSKDDLTVTVADGPLPLLTSLSPNTAQQGQYLSVVITGQNTHFVQGTTTAIFGAGIAVASLTVSSATSATAVLSIDFAAAIGTRDVTLTTGAEVAISPSGFTVNQGVPAITQVSPNSGRQGQQNLSVTIIGQFTNFAKGATTATFGAAVTVLTLTVNSATSATAVINIEPAAAGGTRTVTLTTGSETDSLIGGFAVVSQMPVCTPPPLGIVSWWPLDSSGADIGGGNSGTVQGGQFVSAEVGSGFNSSQGIVTVPAAPSLNVSQFTMETWLRVDSITPFNMVVVWKGRPGSGQDITAPYALGVGGTSSGAPGKVQVTVTDGVSDGEYSSNTALPVGTFHHVAVTADGLRVRIYIDGNLDSDFAELVTPFAGPFPFQIGGIQGVNTNFFQGVIDELTLYNRALSSAEILAIYADGSAGKCRISSISSISPSAGQQGQQNLSVSITGQSTNWVQGATQASFSPGITVVSTTVNTPTSATAVINIDPAAAIGGYNVILTTGSEIDTLTSGFSVTASAPIPTISISPNSGQQGQQNISVTITGQFTHFSQGASIASFGAGVTPGAATVVNGTSLTTNIAIASNAVPGPRSVIVTTGTEVASLSDGFSVVNTPPTVNATARCRETISLSPDEVTATEYTIPTFGSGPFVITAGPDCNLWFSERFGDKIGRMTTAGMITEFSVPTAGSQPLGITSGPDGNLWFTEYAGNKVGKITPDGVITEFATPTANSKPWGITTGPDGNLWFTENGANQVGTITPGGEVTEFHIPTANSPFEVTMGPDGNLWFTENSANQIGKITPQGVITEFPIPAAVGSGLPLGIAAGPDGNLWFAEQNGDIARISTDGVVTGQFVVPTSLSQPSLLTAGPDGNLWFTEHHGGKIGRITTAGTITEYPVPTDSSQVLGIAVGSDRNLYFTEFAGNNTGTANPRTGIAFASLTGTITDDGAPVGAMLTATWNKTNGPGPVSFEDPIATFPDLAGQVYPLSTSATFSVPGIYTLTLTGSDSQSNTSTNVTITVNSPPNQTILSVNPNSGQQGRGGPVAVVGLNTHFAQGTTQVDFGAGITVSNITVSCPTCLTVQLAVAANAPVGPHDVTVTTGAEVVTLIGGFTVTAGTPILTSIVPNNVQQGQTTSITITGNFTHFTQGTTQVSFGAGVTVSSVTVSNAGSLVAQIAVDPTAPTGARPVTVTTGSEVVTSPPVFIVNAATPILFTLNPGGGSQGQQGLSVVIAGLATHFVQGTSGATFGAGVTVTSLTVASATSATAIVNIDPAAVPGTRTVTITTGSETASFTNGFTISASGPIISTLNPGGSSQGATSLPVQITGLNTHFVQGTSVATFGAGITVASLTVTNATTAAATINIDVAATIGTRTVTVTTGTETASFVNGFSVVAGVSGITQINPGGGPQGIQNLSLAVTAQFTHFVQGTTTATFGAGVSVVSLTVNSPLTATVLVNVDPAAALGLRDVTFTTGAEVVTAPGGFTVSLGVPTLLSPSPNIGQQGQHNLPITLTGQLTHFVQGTTTATFGAGITIVSVSVSSPTAAVATINIDSAAAVGLRTVTVTTGAEVASLANGFGVSPGTPALTSVSPNVGQQGQTNLLVTISSQYTHFDPSTTQVSFGAGIAVSAVVVNGATSLTASISLNFTAAPGSRTVTVTTGSEVVSLANSFAVQPLPTGPISVNPITGFQGQTLSVAITTTGTHFTQGVTKARFGPGISVGSAIIGDFGSVTVTSPTTATAQISIVGNALPGSRTVTLQTGAEIVSGPNAFIILGNPYLSAITPTAGNQGATGTVTINGTYTNFVQGTTTATFGAGVTVTSVAVNSANSLVAAIAIDPAATPGNRTITVQTGTEQETAVNGFTVLGPVTGPAPIPSITSPTYGAVITAPTQVTGTVVSPNLASWTLQYEGAGSTVFTQFATGTSATVSGTLDPTLLLNGTATIQLTAVDTSGQSESVAETVIVARNQKIGNFTVSFNDLSVPVARLPIQVVRTYDSRRLSSGDFGVGWTLGLNTVTVSTNIPLGEGWTGTSSGGAFPTYCVQETSQHLITVAFADGTTYQFKPVLSPNGGCQQLVPLSQVNVGFAPVTNTGTTPPNAGLALANSGPYEVLGNFPGSISLVDLDDVTVLDPDQFLSTLPDGRIFQISRQNGLQKETDLNGNTLTVTPAGITHSSGKSVSFVRDGQNRITTITDPAGHTLTYAYDATGNLSTFTDQLNNTSTYTYNFTHGLLTILDPRGVQPIRNDYDANGRLVSHTDAYGNVINYDHDTTNKQEIVTDRLGNITVNQYDTAGNIVKVTDALGGITTRTYDPNGNVLTETNALNQTRTYTYDANNNRLTETDPLSHTTACTYNARNQVLTVTDPLGHVTTNTYDPNGNLLSTKDPSGSTTSYTYNASGFQTSITDALGGITSNQYDGSGNLTQQTDALGNVTTNTYDASGNRLSQTKTRTTASGSETLVTSYQYDALNRLVRTTYPDGTTTQIQYNSIGKQSVTIDQLGRQTSYQYDLMGRLIETDYPDTTSDLSSYDAEGDRVSSTDRAARTTTYVYDPLKRLSKTLYPDSATTKTTYDAIGEVTGVTDPLGNLTQYAYDAAGRRTTVTDALSDVTTSAYDADGNQASMTDANGNTTQYQYDPDNRRTKTIYADGTSDAVAYDALGRTTAKTDQAGLATQFQYDKIGRLTQVTDALSQLTKYTYDEVGNRITQTDANSHTTTFAYDKLGRRTKRTLPLSMFETTTYDAAGNLSAKTDFNGKTTTYAYDVSNRLTSKTPDAGFSAAPITFTYTATGQRLSMTDPSGVTNYTYDLRDRLTQKVTPEGTLSYAFDLGGNLLSMQSSNTGGTSVNYAYDALNRLASVKDNRPGAGTTTYTYDKAGSLQSYLYPNGVQTGYTYNTLNRLTNVAVANGSTALASYAYTLGPAGNRTQVAELGGRQVNYSYDSLYRLTLETIAGAAVNGSIGYLYDAVGNRLQRTSIVAPVPAASSTFDANDRLTSDTYDSNGNTTASGGNGYSYDFENHLTAQTVSPPVGIVYDGDGNRVAKIVSGATTKYLVDDRNLTGYAQVVEELAGGTVQRVYTYGLNRISQSQASGTGFYGYDGHGSVRLLTGATGSVTDRYDYDAFGSILSQAGTTPNVYLYSGEQNDPNLGFYYLRARYLSPSTGRFWTADSYEGSPFDPPSLHRYSYTAQNPITNRDPSGQQLTTVELLVVSSIIGYTAYLGVQGLTDDLEKARTAGFAATLAAAFFLAPQVAIPASGVLQLGNIGLNQAGVAHIDDFHSVFGRFAAAVTNLELGELFRKSVFYPGEDLVGLVRYANTVAPYTQDNGRLAYVVFLTRAVGYDIVTNAPIYYYTVVVNPITRLVVTAFPGAPKDLVP